MCKPEIRKCVLKFLGANMVIASAVTIGLGIADLILTQQIWCGQLLLCSAGLTNAQALTWVAVAVWAPVPIFVNGIGAIWIAGRPSANNGWLCLLSFLNTVAFGPVIVVITALELTNKFQGGVQSMVSSLPTQTAQGVMAMFGIEITIAVVGAVLFLHALAVLYLNCCCRKCLHEEMAHTTGANFDAPGKEVYIDRRQILAPARGPIQDPAQDDIDRMNLWSAYRWMNNGGAVTPPITRTSYYGTGAAPTRHAQGVYSGAAGPYYAPGPRSVLAGGTSAGPYYAPGPRNVLSGGPSAARW